MSSFWKGVLSPTVFKHRDGCGDIFNHIETGDPEIIEELDTDGDGEIDLWIVQIEVRFIAGESLYTYEVEVTDPDDLDQILSGVVEQIPGVSV